MNRSLVRRCLVTAIVAIGAGVGWIVAAAATRPLEVELRTSIDICAETRSGWEVIDRVPPTSVRFTASLLELAGGDAIESAYVLKATTEKGLPYSARLAGPASISANPASGRLDAELEFEVTYGNETARVPGRLTTEAVASPLGTRRGTRTRGDLGGDLAEMTLVSANPFERQDGSRLMLVCTEVYRLTPRPIPRAEVDRPRP